jgi:hypothetical protein
VPTGAERAGVVGGCPGRSKMVQTSLAAQLSALRPSSSQAAHSDAGGLKQRPSLLFSPSEAADLDAEAIHSIGLSGLAELEKQDPSLHKSSHPPSPSPPCAFAAPRSARDLQVQPLHLASSLPSHTLAPGSECIRGIALHAPPPAHSLMCDCARAGGPSRYEKLLFSRSAADFRRESQSVEVLRSLNQSIRGLLKALTPYFLLRPSLKVLEFLVRTYSVQVRSLFLWPGWPSRFQTQRLSCWRNGT